MLDIAHAQCPYSLAMCRSQGDGIEHEGFGGGRWLCLSLLVVLALFVGAGAGVWFGVHAGTN